MSPPRASQPPSRESRVPSVARRPSRRIRAHHVRPAVDPVMPRWWDVSALLAMVASLTLLVLQAEVDLAWTRGAAFLAVDDLLCLVLLVDWLGRARRSQDRRRFLRAHWVELVASIPLVGPLHALRAARLVSVLRLLRVGVLARRVMRRLHLPATSLSLTGLALAVGAFWGASALAFQAFEQGRSASVRSFGDALWWSIVTMSTVGYGDVYPVSTGGRVVAGLTMAFGVGALGTLAGMITSILIELQERGSKGLRYVRMKQHVMVLGWNEKARVAVEEVHRDPRFDDDVVIVAECERNPMERERVAFVRGNPCRRDVLERAGARDAVAAIVLARDVNDARSDYETAMAVTTLRAMSNEVRISAELVSPDHREFLERAGCDAIIDAVSVSSALLVRGVKDAGVPALIEDLLLASHGSVTLQREAIAEDMIGRRWRDVAAGQVDRGRTALGLARANEVIVNPRPEFVVERGDELFVVTADEE